MAAVYPISDDGRIFKSLVGERLQGPYAPMPEDKFFLQPQGIEFGYTSTPQYAKSKTLKDYIEVRRAANTAELYKYSRINSNLRSSSSLQYFATADPEGYSFIAAMSAFQMLKRHDTLLAINDILPDASIPQKTLELEKEFFDIVEEQSTLSAVATTLTDPAQFESVNNKLNELKKRRKKLEEKITDHLEHGASRVTKDRETLWRYYYRISVLQHYELIKADEENRPPIYYVTEDGLAPYTEAKLRQIEFQRMRDEQIKRDQRIIDELEFAFQASQKGLITKGGNAESEYFEGTDIKKAPTLTYIADPNNPNAQLMAEIIIDNAPEYRDSEYKTVDVDAQVARTDYQFWRQNYPIIDIPLDANEHIDSKYIRYPWNPAWGIAPVVNVRVTPRQKEIPEQSGFVNILGQGLSAIAGMIPGLGTPIGLAIGAATGIKSYMDLKEWAGDIKSGIPNSAFAPQYYPEPFFVPLPLDRAQMLEKQPWFAPKAIEDFISEIHKQEIKEFSQVYYELTGKQPPEFLRPNNPANNIPVDSVSSPDDTIAAINKKSKDNAVGLGIAAAAIATLVISSQ